MYPLGSQQGTGWLTRPPILYMHATRGPMYGLDNIAMLPALSPTPNANSPSYTQPLNSRTMPQYRITPHQFPDFYLLSSRILASPDRYLYG